MRFRQNGTKYKYRLEYYKQNDELRVKPPIYSIYRRGSIKQNGVWKNCNFHLFKKEGKTIIEVSPTGIVKDGMSDLGPINEHHYFNRFKLSKFNKTLINLYEKWYDFKILLFRLVDRTKLIKNNIIYISLAFLGATVYFLINHYFDNFLQKLINNSNLAQSLIVFLSLSSIINIFHPFSLRKEVKIGEVDELIRKKSEIMRQDLEDEKWIEENANF